MKNKRNRRADFLWSFGLMVFAAIILIDRFLIPLPDPVAIGLALAGLVLIFIGMVRTRKRLLSEDPKEGQN